MHEIAQSTLVQHQAPHFTHMMFFVFLTVMLSSCSGQNTSSESDDKQYPLKDKALAGNSTHRTEHHITMKANPQTNKSQNKSLILSADNKQSAVKNMESTNLTTEASAPSSVIPDMSKYDVNTPFNHLQPQLMGFTIGSKQQDVIAKIGMPGSTYKMDVPGDSILVYQYPAFSIGFDKNSMIKFIEVDFPYVNPGLNGLRVGDTSQEAVKDLGRPSTNNGYILTYRAGGRMLKIDVDPQQHTILSVKLLPME